MFKHRWSGAVVQAVAEFTYRFGKLPTYICKVAFMQFSQRPSPLSSQWECFGVCVCVCLCVNN